MIAAPESGNRFRRLAGWALLLAVLAGAAGCSSTRSTCYGDATVTRTTLHFNLLAAGPPIDRVSFRPVSLGEARTNVFRVVGYPPELARHLQPSRLCLGLPQSDYWALKEGRAMAWSNAVVTFAAAASNSTQLYRRTVQLSELDWQVHERSTFGFDAIGWLPAGLTLALKHQSDYALWVIVETPSRRKRDSIQVAGDPFDPVFWLPAWSNP